MSHLFQNYNRAAIEFVKAEGNTLIDSQGKVYLDFSTGIGVTGLGFHPQVVTALEEQVAAIWHTPNLYQNSLQEAVAEQLTLTHPDYLAFFCNSGAEANEAAIKLARKASGKEDIISFNQSFHGRTFGAMSATGQDKIKQGFGAGVPHFHYATYNDLESVKALVTDQTAAVMLELVQGESGVVPADAAFVSALADYCQSQGILLIVDEVQTGMGRTGHLYAFEHYGISPDIFTLAKGLANGVPVGAMLGKQELGWALDYGSHGSTFGGNKLAMKAAQATLNLLQAPGFLTQVQEKASYLMGQLQEQLGDLSSVVEIRGLGAMIGIQTKASLQAIVSQAREQGLIVLTAGSDVIRLLPPLTLTTQEIDQGVSILKSIFEAID
ncbi:acetylornithine transaminase [Streptococcus sp. DD12]|uniref:acetylornithine transaminase n=1 Tax=Streptococcus sp. DD12 TaxID=1777880 RepID=UPI0007978893|nr:acetylornithine transaminase [Streptococcus sp. DD12]KXT75835.1 Acetylornithine aminotransferase [Streptococcus sp. DD12]